MWLSGRAGPEGKSVVQADRDGAWVGYRDQVSPAEELPSQVWNKVPFTSEGAARGGFWHEEVMAQSLLA